PTIQLFLNSINQEEQNGLGSHDGLHHRHRRSRTAAEERISGCGERSLRRALQQYVAHYHEERNHQGKQNRLLFPLPNRGASGDNGIGRCKERLGGLLKYYEREAARAFGRVNSPSSEA